ncbi:LacI family DNA-binding transcriptional regulator [Jiangella endophytica]|uniref:LacI family DNA-binding transcriptional regulator n=1 Tax=Jiangella endophytica TaxID=1623398 RepID=UPI001E30E0AD|nr:LacI family DNA-binding transcriptional regulator [Jiangella endophytica]
MREVAAKAGVSVAVVSAVVSGGSGNVRLSEETRQRVLRTVEATGYRRNHAARALRSSHAGVISVVIPRVTNAVLARAMEGMQQLAQDEGLVLMLTDANWIVADGKVSNLMTRLSGTGIVDGFIVRTTSVGNEAVADLTARGVPLVILHEPFPGHDHVCVWVDDEPGVRAAAEHLIELGHEHIAMIGGPRHDIPDDAARSRGFRAALAEHDLPLTSQSILAVGYGEAEIAAAIRKLFQAATPPTGIVVDNVVAAPAAMATVVDLGLRVPDDVSVIAYHDIDAAGLTRPSLSTVKMPVEEAGRKGLETLLRLIAGEPAESVLVSDPPPVVIQRQSTAPPSRTRHRRRT